MDNNRKESLIERIKDGFNTAIGLPPGRLPHDEPKPTNERDDDAPRKTLTADDAEGLPPHQGTGIKPIE
jgi:hypothetical protein